MGQFYKQKRNNERGKLGASVYSKELTGFRLLFLGNPACKVILCLALGSCISGGLAPFSELMRMVHCA